MFFSLFKVANMKHDSMLVENLTEIQKVIQNKYSNINSILSQCSCG